MEDFGNYIFLIFVVVVLLSNMKKKKKSDTPKPEEKKHYEQATWQELKPVVERREFEKVVKAPTSKPVEEYMENTYATYDTVGNDISELRIKKPVKVSIENSHHLIEEDRYEESNSIPLELDSPEAAKKAFIYSVIFERKY